MITPHRLMCDCGCNETLAMEYDDRIVVEAKRHGRRHVLVIPKSHYHNALTFGIDKTENIVVTE